MQESPLRSHTWSLATPLAPHPLCSQDGVARFGPSLSVVARFFLYPPPPLCAAAVAASGRWSVVGGSWRWWR